MATVLLVSNHAEATYDFGYSGTLLAQTFVVPAGYDRLDYIKLKIEKLGSPSGNVTLSIYATSGGVPIGSALASVTVAQSSIADGVETFNFTDLAVTAGAKYAIVWNGGGTSGSSTSAWRCTHSNTYGNGDSFYKLSGGSWVANGYDMYFEAWGYQSALPPTVTTDSVGTVTSSGFTVAGDVSSDGGATITERGVVVSSTNAVPTTGDAKTIVAGTTGAISAPVTGLSPGTLYYIRAYAINSQGTSYGDVLTQVTDAVAPTVTSDSSSAVGSVIATALGTVTDLGGANVTERGIAYGTSSNPTTAGTKVVSGSGLGAFSANITGLTPATLYHYRAYAINSVGTAYGADKTFTTLNQVKYWAQSFTAGATGTLTKISLAVKLLSGTSGNLKVRIYSDNAGSPNALLYTATTVVLTNTAFAYIDIIVNQAVTNTTKYWIIIEDPLVVGSYELAIGSASAGGYAGGEIKYTKVSAPTTWINTSHTTDDMAFYVYIQPSLTTAYDIEIRSRKLYK